MKNKFRITTYKKTKPNEHVVRIDDREDWKLFAEKYGTDLIFYRLLNLFAMVISQCDAENNWKNYENIMTACPAYEMEQFYTELKEIILAIRREALDKMHK